MTRRAAAPVHPEREPKLMDCACNFYGEKDTEYEDEPYVVKCPSCRKENYAMSVSSGICAWCGWKAPMRNARKK